MHLPPPRSTLFPYTTLFRSFTLLVNSGCSLFGAKKKIQVPQLLPGEQAGTARLFQEVNRLSNVNSLHAKLDIQFEDTSFATRSEEHTSELQSHVNLVCRLLL